MNHSISVLRIRFLICVLAVIGMLLVPAAGLVQGTSSFTLTSALWTCANPTVQTAWITQGTVSSMHIRATNTSLDDAEATTVTNPSQTSHSLVLSRLNSIDKIAVTAYMSDGSVWEFFANAGSCDVAGSITGGRVDAGSDISINVMNASCSGFDWSVSSSDEVRVYVSVDDTIGRGMIPYVPQNGTQLSGSESYVVETENQMWFNIFIAVYDLVTNERLASRSVPMSCPIFVPPGPTPMPMPTIAPDVDGDNDTETTVNIHINLPGGKSIEGAPYSVFAPMAAQFEPQPYQQGVVGANNMIVLSGLIPGDYRLLIEPEGMDPIDVVFTVGTAQVTDLVLTLDTEGNATVALRQPEPVPTVPASASADSVNTLPVTGAGTSASAFPLMLLGLLGSTVTLAGLMMRQRTGSNRQ